MLAQILPAERLAASGLGQAADVKLPPVMQNLVAQFGGDLGLQTLDPVGAEFDDGAGFNVDHVVMVGGVGGFEPGRGTFERMALDDALLFQFGQGALDGGERNPGITGLHPFVQFGGVGMVIGRGQNLGQHGALTGHAQTGVAHRLFEVAGLGGKLGHAAE